MSQCDKYEKSTKILEQVLARDIPVFEAEFGLSEETPLCIYDCLVPRIREHKQNKIMDLKANLKVDDLKA